MLLTSSFLFYTAAAASVFTNSGVVASGSGLKDHHHRNLVVARDASTLMSKGDNNEGEAHGDIKAPSGSIFTSLPVGDDGEEIGAYWTKDAQNSSSTHAYIMIHGRLRDGDAYWTTMNDILQKAIQDDEPGADANGIVVAPQFFSKKYNSGQYSKETLAWGDVNAWQAGEAAIHPSKSKQTSFDALDALVEEFMNAQNYPKLKNVTVVGHGGGGQLIQRYAMVASNPSNAAIHVRYIHGDASSCAYFTKNRPTKISGAKAKLPKRKDCKYYNTWRYGFDNFTGTAHGLKTPQEYFQQYITRDVVSIVGYKDVKSSGDTYCMAQMQGGTKRRDRNLAWWQYVNLLARTNEDLDGFPATFGKLPDWSSVSGNRIATRLAVVEDADHDAEEVFSGKTGRSALFGVDVEVGWRPKGWKAAKPVRIAQNGNGKASSSSAEHASTFTSRSAAEESQASEEDNVSLTSASASILQQSSSLLAALIFTLSLIAMLLS